MIALLVVLLLLATPASALAATASTTFDGSENPLSEGGTWTAVGGGFQSLIKTSGVVGWGGSGDSAMYWTGTAFTVDQRSTVVVDNATNIGGPTCRNDGIRFYAAHFGTTGGGIRKWTTFDNNTILSSFSGSVSAGASVAIRCTGTTTTTITAEVNGLVVSSVVDSGTPFTTGQPGIAIFTAARTFTSWTGSDVVADTTPPSVPTNVQATPATSSSVALTWNASTDNVAVTGYVIARCQGAACSPTATVTTVPTPGHTDTGLAAGTVYRYTVSATDGTNTSAASSVAEATTLATRTVTCTWQDNSSAPQEDGFTLQRCEGLNCLNFADLTTVGVGVTSFQDTASPNPTGGYRVRANLSGTPNSGYSNIDYTSASSTGLLSTTPASLSFTATVGAGNPASKSLTVTNNAGATGMAWTIADDATWLTCAPSSGTDTTQTTCSVSITGLTADVYQGIVTVTAPGATGTPVAVPVTLTLNASSVPSVGRGGRIR